MSKSANHRFMKRIDWQALVIIRAMATPQKPIDEQAHLKNISKRGLGIHTSAHLMRNTLYVFEFRLNDRTWNLPGEVIHEKKGTADTYYGIRFASLTNEDRRQWDNFLRPLSSKMQMVSVLYGVLAGFAAGFVTAQFHVSISTVCAVFFAALLVYMLFLPR